VNDEVIGNPGTEDTAGPFSLLAGAADVAFFDSSGADCIVDDPAATASVVFPDQGRLTIRNGADTRGTNVDIWGITPGGIDTMLFSDVVQATPAFTG